MAELPAITSDPLLEQWRQRLQRLLPDENPVVGKAGEGSFRVVDQNTVIFRFDPSLDADGHDVEYGDDPDFLAKRAHRIYSDAAEVEVNLGDAFLCGKRVYFRVRSFTGAVIGDWSPTKIFSTPIPAALTSMIGGHAVDGVETENPIINVNMILPRTATVGVDTIVDHEGVWTDHVDLEADWSTLNGAINDSVTTINVPAGHGVYFKPQGYYKIEDEIVKVTSVLVDALTVERAKLETVAAAHIDTTVIRFYARVLREMFSGTQSGLYGVTVTIPNPEKVRQRDFDAWAVNRCGQRGPITQASAILALPALISDLAADPRFQKVVFTWSELPWSAYRYEIYHSLLGVIPIGDADPTLTAGVELLVRPLADHAGEATWVHEVIYAAGVVHYYGVRAVDILGGFAIGGGDTAGPLQPDQNPTPLSPDVTNISATEGPAAFPTGPPTRARFRSMAALSLVTCGFDAPTIGADPDGLFDRCRVYMQPVGVAATLVAAIPDGVQTTMRISLADLPNLAYWRYFIIDAEVIGLGPIDYSKDPTVEDNVTITRGELGTSAVSHLISANVTHHIKPKPTTAEGPEAPLDFTHQPVGSVALYFVSVNIDGRANQVLSSPNLTVTLDGQTSAPLEVQNLRGIKTASGGKVFWSEGIEPDLDFYEVADLGSRTLVNQADIADKHIVATVLAENNSDVRASWEWQEVEYAGEVQQGSSTVILGTAAAALDELTEERYDPIGAPPVSETLRFSRSSIEADLSTTDYVIDSNTESTVVLTSAPSEATSGNAIVHFYIGGRAHKFYVRAVNQAGLASEWRPVEGTFLELSALAPDGTRDVGPPGGLYVTGTFSTNESGWTLGHQATLPVGSLATEDRPGTVWFQLYANGELEDEADFDEALKRNISGITEWEITLTHSSGIVVKSVKATNQRGNYALYTPPVNPKRWRLLNSFFVDCPNVGITAVSVRIKNWYGWSAPGGPTAGGLPAGAGPHYTGPLDDLQPLITETPLVSAIHPNISEGRRFKVELSTTDVTIEVPEYRGANTTKGAGNGVRVGEQFTITIEQPSAGTPRSVTWDAAYKGLDGKDIDMRYDRYSSWTFLVEDTDYFRLISFLTGSKL